MQKSFSTKFILAILCFLLFQNNVFAQKKKPKFGKISLDQVKETAHPKFMEAPAVKLFDYGETRYQLLPGSGLQVVFDRHVAIKFYNQNDLALEYATFEVPLYHNARGKDRLSNIKAVTYSMTDGKISMRKLDKKNEIFTEELNRNRDLKKFTMPNVKEGSVIEVMYTVTSDFVFNMEPWMFQELIPTVYSEYAVQVPEFFTFNKNLTGFIAPQIHKPKSVSRDGYVVNIQKWSMENVPAFESEDHMRSFRNYISRIEFELHSIQLPYEPIEYFTKSWESIGKDLMDYTSFGGQLKKGSVGAEVLTLAAKGGASQENLVSVFENVKRSMKWNGRRHLTSRQGIKKAFKEKEGTSADINLLLITALREAGFSAYPVVLSTRKNGMLPLSNPSIDKLNYVIAAVELEGKMYLMDATEDALPIGLLPVRCFNGNGKIIGNNFVKNIKISPTEKYKNVIQNTFTLSEDGTLSGTTKKSKAGYSALNFRRTYAKENDEEAFVKKMEEENEGLTIESHSFENVAEIYKNIKEEYEVSIEDQVEIAGDLIYLNPMLHDATKENPFKLEKRAYPVDFAVPIEETYLLKLKLPEGYAVESLPEKVMVTLPEKACQFIYSVTATDGEVSITSRIKINKVIYTEVEYEFIKEFFNQIIQKHSEQVVLKKM